MGTSGAAGYSSFVAEVRSATAGLLADPTSADTTAVRGLLDGTAAARLRDLVPLERRRSDGIFFTGSVLRERLVRGLELPGDGVVFDPAVGAADLLLAVAEHLPLGATLSATVAAWGGRLAGTDVHPEFVAAARSRLLLHALRRHALRGDPPGPPVDEGTAFPRVRQGDGLRALLTCAADGVTAAVLNPPFSPVRAPAAYPWGDGRTTQAALFLAATVAHLPAGAPFAAVLPDVLRTGSRYARLRARLEATCDLDPPEALGPQFDEHTDVHVFLLRGRTRLPGPAAAPTGWWRTGTGATVGDRFTVSVGSVVDNRDARDGPELPYLKAAELPIRGEHLPAGRTRAHAGKSFVPPFVVVRRTSRPSRGSARSPGVLVLGDRPVHVDNHLLVAAPLAGGLGACRDLLRRLDSDTTTDWLDGRIRCRHLTVGSLRELPLGT